MLFNLVHIDNIITKVTTNRFTQTPVSLATKLQNTFGSRQRSQEVKVINQFTICKYFH